MRKLLIVFSLPLAVSVALACGDKLALIVGLRSSQVRSQHAFILAYPGRNASAAVIRDLQLQPTLKKAGYRVQVVEDAAGLDNVLKGNKFDLVVADVTDAAQLNEHLSAAPSKPLLLPVAFKASKEEQLAAQKTYHCLLKAPSSPENYLAAVDQALDWKLKTAKR